MCMVLLHDRMETIIKVCMIDRSAYLPTSQSVESTVHVNDLAGNLTKLHKGPITEEGTCQH